MTEETSSGDWYDTTGHADWRGKISMLKDVDVPSPVPTKDYESMSDVEQQIYSALLDETRKRQNGDRPEPGSSTIGDGGQP